jgi:hypothetical protein
MLFQTEHFNATSILTEGVDVCIVTVDVGAVDDLQVILIGRDGDNATRPFEE